MISQTDIDTFVSDLTARLHASEAENARLAAEVAHLRKALGKRKDDARRWRAKAQRTEGHLRNVIAHATMGTVDDGEKWGLNDICCKITALRNVLWNDAVARTESRILSAIQKEGEA